MVNVCVCVCVSNITYYQFEWISDIVKKIQHATTAAGWKTTALARNIFHAGFFFLNDRKKSRLVLLVTSLRLEVNLFYIKIYNFIYPPASMRV